MRKNIALSFLLPFTVPFGFSKMKPCYQNFSSKIKKYNIDIIRFYDIRILKSVHDKQMFEVFGDKAMYLFLYDNKTGFSLGSYISKDIENLKQCGEFFLGKSNEFNNLLFFNLQENLNLRLSIQKKAFRISYVQGSHSLYDEPPMYLKVQYSNLNKNFIKDFNVNEQDEVRDPLRYQLHLGLCSQSTSHTPFVPEKTLDPQKISTYIAKGCLHLWNQCGFAYNKKEGFDQYPNDAIKLADCFDCGSNIKIENKDDNVFINGYNFEKALRKYFNIEKEGRNMAIFRSVNDIQNDYATGKASYDLSRVGYDLSENGRKDELELLNKSKILRVYAVLKGKQGKNSLVWGLAEDKESKERFHWFTDLKADVSVLINQYK